MNVLYFGNAYYYSQNNIGSTTLLTNKDGSDVGEFLYSPFGEMWVEEASTVDISHITRFFTNQQYDKESGLYYYNARFYDPHLGSFITPDPAMDGINHYAYANSNPIKYSDPTGLYDFDPMDTTTWGGYDGAPQHMQDTYGGGSNPNNDTNSSSSGDSSSSGSILSWLNEPKIKNDLNNPFKDNPQDNDFTYNWTPGNGKDQAAQLLAEYYKDKDEEFIKQSEERRRLCGEWVERDEKKTVLERIIDNLLGRDLNPLIMTGPTLPFGIKGGLGAIKGISSGAKKVSSVSKWIKAGGSKIGGGGKKQIYSFVSGEYSTVTKVAKESYLYSTSTKAGSIGISFGAGLAGAPKPPGNSGLQTAAYYVGSFFGAIFLNK